MDVQLRNLWEDAKSKHPILEDFDVDPYYVLQAVAIFTARAKPSCKRGDVLRMKVEQIQEGREPVVRSLAAMLQMLLDDFVAVDIRNPVLVAEESANVESIFGEANQILPELRLLFLQLLCKLIGSR